MRGCDTIPADAWEQLPRPVWPALRTSGGVPDFVELGGVHPSGFLCFNGDFARLATKTTKHVTYPNHERNDL